MSETPVTRPAPSVVTFSTIAWVTSVQRPVASARGSMVFWVPALASDGHGKPTQEPQPMQAARPARSTELIDSGGDRVSMPSVSAPFASIMPAAPRGIGGIG